MFGLADAELFVDSLLHCWIIGSQAAFAFFTVAVVASDDRVGQGIDVDGRFGGGFASGELVVDSLLNSGVVLAEAALALVPVAVVSTDHRFSESVDVHSRVGR